MDLQRGGALAGMLALALLFAGNSPAQATEPFCPENAIKIVAPFPPGGPTDITARLLAEKLRVQLGQTVITESRPGASGSIGTGFVAQQPGNGCTILLSYDTHAVNPALLPLPFDTVNAFKPVMLIGTLPNAVAVHASQPWKSFAELVAAAKKDHLVYASGASAGVAYFSMKLIEQIYGDRDAARALQGRGARRAGPARRPRADHDRLGVRAVARRARRAGARAGADRRQASSADGRRADRGRAGQPRIQHRVVDGDLPACGCVRRAGRAAARGARGRAAGSGRARPADRARRRSGGLVAGRARRVRQGRDRALDRGGQALRHQGTE